MGFYTSGPPGPRWPKWVPTWVSSRLDGLLDTLAVINAVFGIILPVFGLFVGFALLCMAGVFLMSWLAPK